MFESNPERIRTALFVDFDNIYRCLEEENPEAAARFADKPEDWLSWLARNPFPRSGELFHSRSILVRRCYLSPGRHGKYRNAFVRAGFEVVDCPCLTNQGKNGGDIRMALDVMDALGHRTSFEEFVILSGDSDFTPVLQRIRAHDRATVVLAPSRASICYRACADQVLGYDVFVREALHLDGEPDLQARVRQALMQAVQGGPVDFSRLATLLRAELGDLLGRNWAGAGTLGSLIRDCKPKGLRVGRTPAGLVLYDPRRHALPTPEPAEMRAPEPADSPDALRSCA